MKKLVKKKRDLIEKILMIVGGIIVMAIGFMILIASIPLMIIIIGLFTFIGSIAVIIFGFKMILNSIYISVKCPNCFKKVNPIMGDRIICKACKNIIKF